MTCPTCGFTYTGEIAVKLGKVGVCEAEGGDEYRPSLTALANAYRDIGKCQRALDLLQKALEIEEVTGGQGQCDLIWILNSFGQRLSQAEVPAQNGGVPSLK